MTTNADNMVVFCTTSNSLIDYVRPGEDHATACARLAEYGTSLTVLPAAVAWQRHEGAAKTKPSEITAERFDYALNVLPPVAWTRDSNGESVKLSERQTGIITSIYVQLKGRFFTFDDSIRLPHAECCRVVRFSEAYLAAEQRSSDGLEREIVRGADCGASSTCARLYPCWRQDRLAEKGGDERAIQSKCGVQGLDGTCPSECVRWQQRRSV